MLMPNVKYRDGFVIVANGNAKTKRDAWQKAKAAGVKLRTMYVSKDDAQRDADRLSKASGATFAVVESIY